MTVVVVLLLTCLGLTVMGSQVPGSDSSTSKPNITTSPNTSGGNGNGQMNPSQTPTGTSGEDNHTNSTQDSSVSTEANPAGDDRNNDTNTDTGRQTNTSDVTDDIIQIATTRNPGPVTDASVNTSNNSNTNLTEATDEQHISDSDNVTTESDDIIIPSGGTSSNVEKDSTTVNSATGDIPDTHVTDTSVDGDDGSVLGAGTTESGIGTLEPGRPTAPDWLSQMLNIHHFEGQYSYDGASYLFDFVVRYRHQLDDRTLVADFYDEDKAVLEMNGTSADGHKVTFTMARMLKPGIRFVISSQVELQGCFVTDGQATYYKGNITKPANSSFTTFYMNKGLGAIETESGRNTRTAIIIVIPTCVGFVIVLSTVVLMCWAWRKGYLRGRHKKYHLFSNVPVSYESEAQTIHI